MNLIQLRRLAPPSIVRSGRVGLLAFILAGGVIPSAAWAQSVEQDARCLVASSVFARTEKDAGKRQLAVAVRYFYLGRIDARAAGPALRTVLQAQAKAITPANVGQTMTNCARSMQSKETALSTLAGSGK